MEPFTRAHDYKSLSQALNQALDARHHLATAPTATATAASGPGGSSRTGGRQVAGGEPAEAAEEKENQFQLDRQASLMLMSKRQLVASLNCVFLGELKANLIERAHEFTDCAYTKHEHRETIVLLLAALKLLLNKLVKLLYQLVSLQRERERERPVLETKPAH